MHDLNQISYDCTMVVTNIFKGLDLWTAGCNTGVGTGVNDQNYPKEKEMQESKVVV